MGNPEDVKNPDKPDKLQFKEPIVLSSMPYVCLMLLSGINFAVDNTFFYYPSQIYFRLKHYYATIPVIATFLITILSEYKGRKPTLIILSAASIVSIILHAFPNQEICKTAGCVLQGVVRGGVFSTTFLAISEYCSPKHRFAYLIANMAAFNVGFELTYLLFLNSVLNVEDMSEVQLIEGVLGLVCFVVVCLGPESPYWLARHGRLLESRRALLWLRGEGSEPELGSILQQPHRRRSPRLFWLPLLAGISAISITIFSKGFLCISSVYLNIFDQNDLVYDLLGLFPFITLDLGSLIIIVPIIIMLSYKVNHKSLFLAISVIPLALSYSFAVWLYFDPNNEHYPLIFKYLLLTCRATVISGPYLFGIVMCAEIIPPKYNTYIISVCFIYYYPMDLFSCFPNLELPGYTIHGLAILNTTLASFFVIVFYFLSPKTKNKMLLETQDLYMPKQRY